MALSNHSDRAHAVLSASSSSRWLKCPPSAVAATMYPSIGSDYTREGTLAHEVAEAIASGQSPDVLHGDIDKALGGCDMTHEMVD